MTSIQWSLIAYYIILKSIQIYKNVIHIKGFSVELKLSVSSWIFLIY